MNNALEYNNHLEDTSIARDVGSIIKVGGTQIEGHLDRVLGSQIEHLVWELKNANQLGGPGACSPGKF